MEAGSNRNLSYLDLQLTPQNDKRYELVHGELFVTASPTPIHQRISKRLEVLLIDYFEGRAIGEVFHAPIDVILTNHDVFVPDILVVSDPRHISNRGIEQPPLLVLEILSPATRSHDCGSKARRYAELGVEHYWIVDPQEQRIKCHRLCRGVFERVAQADRGETLAHPDWDGLSVDLTALWL